MQPLHWPRNTVKQWKLQIRGFRYITAAWPCSWGILRFWNTQFLYFGSIISVKSLYITVPIAFESTPFSGDFPFFQSAGTKLWAEFETVAFNSPKNIFTVVVIARSSQSTSDDASLLKITESSAQNQSDRGCQFRFTLNVSLPIKFPRGLWSKLEKEYRGATHISTLSLPKPSGFAQKHRDT